MRGRLLFTIVLLSPWLFGITIDWVGDGANGWATGDDLDAANLQLVKPVFDDHDTRLNLIEANGWVTLVKLATDAKTVTNLTSACTDAQVLGGTPAATGVECQTDDDVPESGDFGALGLTGPVTSTGTATAIANDALALGTKTTGNYVASVADSGASEITPTNCTTEGGACTLGIGAALTRDNEAHAKVLGSATANAMCKLDASGNVVASGVICDGSNNCTIPGTLTVGGQAIGLMTLSTNTTTPGTTSGTRGDINIDTDGTTNAACVNTSATTGTTWKCWNLN